MVIWYKLFEIFMEIILNGRLFLGSKTSFLQTEKKNIKDFFIVLLRLLSQYNKHTFKFQDPLTKITSSFGLPYHLFPLHLLFAFFYYYDFFYSYNLLKLR